MMERRTDKSNIRKKPTFNPPIRPNTRCRTVERDAVRGRGGGVREDVFAFSGPVYVGADVDLSREMSATAHLPPWRSEG